MLTAEWMTEPDFQHSRKMMLNCSGIAEVTHLWQCVRPPVSISCQRPASVSCEGNKPTGTHERHTWRWMIGLFEQVTRSCSSEETRQTFALVNWSSSKTASGKLWKATLILISGASKCTVAPPTTSTRLKKTWRAQVIWTQFCFTDQLFLIKRFCLVFLTPRRPRQRRSDAKQPGNQMFRRRPRQRERYKRGSVWLRVEREGSWNSLQRVELWLSESTLPNILLTHTFHNTGRCCWAVGFTILLLLGHTHHQDTGLRHCLTRASIKRDNSHPQYTNSGWH